MRKTLKALTFALALVIGAALVVSGQQSAATGSAVNGAGVVSVTCFTYPSGTKFCEDAANKLGQRNGTNAQSLRIYGTSTGASLGEWLELTNGSNVDATSDLGLFTQFAGGGAPRAFKFGSGGWQWSVTTAGNLIDINNTHTVTAGAGVLTTPTVVGSLPTCNAAAKSQRSFVTDANATFTAGIGAVVVGGGANNVPVTCDGTNWRIG